MKIIDIDNVSWEADADKRTIIAEVETTLDRTRNNINKAMIKRQNSLFDENAPISSYEKNRLKVLKNIEKIMFSYCQKLKGLEK